MLESWRRVESRWTLIRITNRRESTLVVRCYSGSELRDMLLAAGFSAVVLHGNLTGDAYDQNAARLVATR